LHDWMKGNHRPALALLVGVADRTGCSVADILDGRADDAHQPDGRIVRPRRNTSLRVTRAQRQAITQHLASALCDPVPAPLLQVARQLKVNCDYLRDRYPQQSAAIVVRFKAYQRDCAAAKRAGFSAALRARAEQLVSQGVWPTFKHLLSGLKPADRYANLQAAVNLVLARARRQIARSHLTSPLRRIAGLHQCGLQP
jgi:hypothetical protein